LAAAWRGRIEIPYHVEAAAEAQLLDREVAAATQLDLPRPTVVVWSSAPSAARNKNRQVLQHLLGRAFGSELQCQR
jgi:hypothetical protein